MCPKRKRIPSSRQKLASCLSRLHQHHHTAAQRWPNVAELILWFRLRDRNGWNRRSFVYCLLEIVCASIHRIITSTYFSQILTQSQFLGGAAAAQLRYALVEHSSMNFLAAFSEPIMTHPSDSREAALCQAPKPGMTSSSSNQIRLVHLHILDLLMVSVR